MLNDLRYGLRLVRKSPGFTAVAVLTMAVGISASTTVFSWINSVLRNPFPGAGDSGRLVMLESLTPSGEHINTSYPDYRDIRDASTLLEGVALAEPRPLHIGEREEARRVWSELVSGNYFDVLRVKPTLGRLFTGAEQGDAPGAHPVAVISHALWKSRFHGDPAVVGSTIRLNRYPFTVVGVTPEDFHGSMVGLAFDIWVPATMYEQLTATAGFFLSDRKTRPFRSIARLKPGVTIVQGRQELEATMRRLAETHATTNRGISATLVPAWQASSGVQSILLAPLGILMGVCGVVLLIVCANVANLLLARATAREREFSIRLALGARRGRLLRQLLTETLLLAATGSTLALVMAQWLGNSLAWLLPATSYPIRLNTPLDPVVLAFTALLAVLVALAGGLAPALYAANPNLHDTLKAGGRTGMGSTRSERLRGALVVAEIALAAVALVGAGLFVKSFETARTINPGFDPKGVLLTQFHLATAGYNREQANLFCRRLREELESTPGVTAVTYADSVPLGFGAGSWEDLEIEGYVPGPAENMKIDRNLVAPGYFSLMRIPLLQGRDFTGHDDEKSLPVMIVNQEFLRRFLPDQNPLGRKVRGWGRWFTIVGVARDSKYHNLAENPRPYFYIPIRQVYRSESPVVFHIRTGMAPESAIALVRQAGQRIDPSVGMFEAMPFTEAIGASLYGQKVAASLLSALGLVAMLLAAIGLYGVMAFLIGRRTQEIGIRMALGAAPRDILKAVMAQGMLYLAIGVAIGSIASAVLARLVSAALIAVSPVDVQVYAAVAGFLALVSLAAAWIPARRAMKVDPVVSLRYQ